MEILSDLLKYMEVKGRIFVEELNRVKFILVCKKICLFVC